MTKKLTADIQQINKYKNIDVNIEQIKKVIVGEINKTERAIIGEVKKTGPEGKQGQPGLDGKSSYELWLEAGNTGSLEEFLEMHRFSVVHNQLEPSAEWEISHNLSRWPTITIVDSGGSVVIGDISYIDEATVVIRFQTAFSGRAYVN